MSYTNYRGRAAYYGNVSEIKKRAAFDAEKRKDLVGMIGEGIQMGSKIKKNIKDKKELQSFAKTQGLKYNKEDDIYIGSRSNNPGVEPSYEFSVTPAQLESIKGFTETGLFSPDTFFKQSSIYKPITGEVSTAPKAKTNNNTPSMSGGGAIGGTGITSPSYDDLAEDTGAAGRYLTTESGYPYERTEAGEIIDFTTNARRSTDGVWTFPSGGQYKFIDCKMQDYLPSQQIGRDKLQELINILPKTPSGDIKDTEVTRRDDGSMVKVNPVEKYVYENLPNGQSIVDSIAGLPKRRGGMPSQQVDPQALSQIVSSAAQGGGDSGDTLKSIGMAAAGAAFGPAGTVFALGADWIYGSAQEAKAVREQKEKLESGVESLQDSLSTAQDVLSEKTQNALNVAETKLDSLISTASNQLGDASKTVEATKKKAKGLSTGAGANVVTDLSNSIQESLIRNTEAVSDATYTSIGDIGRSGGAEIENIGFQIEDFKDQIKTLEGQDSTYEQMLGSNIGGKLEEWMR